MADERKTEHVHARFGEGEYGGESYFVLAVGVKASSLEEAQERCERISAPLLAVVNGCAHTRLLQGREAVVALEQNLATHRALAQAIAARKARDN